jgi:trehalose 6-phosphate synthase
VDHLDAVHLLDVGEAEFDRYYDVVANSFLWFVHHGLFDSTHTPVYDDEWYEAWSSYRRVNTAFAHAVCRLSPADAVVLVQDYHLTLVALYLADRRPDLRCVHFSHTPFTDPHGLRHLPDDAADEMLRGLAAHVACGFHTRRWAEQFEACCADRGVRPPTTFVAPLGPDPDELRTTAHSAAVTEATRTVAALAGDHQLIVRVDRIEPSKNIVRGFHAYGRLLERRPDLHGRVQLLSLLDPSRLAVPVYANYLKRINAVAAEINDTHGTDGWLPIDLRIGDNFPVVVAAYREYDALLVNSIADGMNLISKEAPLLNERDGVVVLSERAGSFEELKPWVLRVDPLDVEQTAAQLERALELPQPERGERAAAIRAFVEDHDVARWIDLQLVDLEFLGEARA